MQHQTEPGSFPRQASRLRGLAAEWKTCESSIMSEIIVVAFLTSELMCVSEFEIVRAISRLERSLWPRCVIGDPAEGTS